MKFFIKKKKKLEKKIVYVQFLLKFFKRQLIY